MSMIYQFERSEIKQCQNCDFAFGGGNLKIHYRYCSRQDEILDGHKTPQENDCPLVAISKTETTSARSLSCWYCTEIEKHGVVTVKTVLDKSGRELDAYKTPYNYCPACGRKLD